MRKVITYGTYDLLHQGHINLLKRAKELGDWLIVGVTTDNYDLERGKMNTSQNVIERIEAVKNTGLADQIVLEEYAGQKIDDIQKFGVDVFAIGSDWEGEFDYLNEYCKVVYLPRTEGISSTMLRTEKANVNIGVIGTGSIATRFVEESKFVNGQSISSVYNPLKCDSECFANQFGIEAVSDSLQDLFDHCDAVYIASPYYTHYDYSKMALMAGKHVLCETPMPLSVKQLQDIINISNTKRKVFMLAHKTAFCPAYRHLISLLKSGIIGDIVDVSASVTTLIDESQRNSVSDKFGGSMIEDGCFSLLPIFDLLGTEWKNINFYSRMENGVDMYTKAVLYYDKAIASMQVGLGVKTEGNMVISGTKGYVYVPAPWWKPDYFEVRFEDQNRNKKFFYSFEGEGLRYEIKEFLDSICYSSKSTKLSEKQLIAMANVYEDFLLRKNLYTI